MDKKWTRLNLVWLCFKLYIHSQFVGAKPNLNLSSSCLSDVDDDREGEGDADDGEENAEHAARRRHRRDVAVTCEERKRRIRLNSRGELSANVGRVPKGRRDTVHWRQQGLSALGVRDCGLMRRQMTLHSSLLVL